MLKLAAESTYWRVHTQIGASLRGKKLINSFHDKNKTRAPYVVAGGVVRYVIPNLSFEREEAGEAGQRYCPVDGMGN